MNFDNTQIEFEFTARKGQEAATIRALTRKSIDRLHIEFFDAGWNVGAIYDKYGKPITKFRSHKEIFQAG